jgi:hypothetical protein
MPEAMMIDVRLSDGSQRTVAALGTGVAGLVANRTPELEDGSGEAWRVTHQTSGLCVPGLFRTLEQTRQFAELVDGLADWTRPCDEINSPDLGRAMKAAVELVAASDPLYGPPPTVAGPPYEGECSRFWPLSNGWEIELLRFVPRSDNPWYLNEPWVALALASIHECLGSGPTRESVLELAREIQATRRRDAEAWLAQTREAVAR